MTMIINLVLGKAVPKISTCPLIHEGAVTIVCYEIFKTINKKFFSKKSINLKTSSKFKISALVKHLVNLLEKKDFFIPKEKKQSMLLNINNLIYRFEPNDKELRILASIISSLSKNNS